MAAALLKLLQGEWCDEQLVLRFDRDVLTIATADDRGVVTEKAYAVKVSDDATTIRAEPADAGEKSQRTFTVVSAPADGALSLMEAGTALTLRQTYGGDSDSDGGNAPAHDTSGTDLGMELCVVGTKIDDKTHAALGNDDPAAQ